MRNIRQVLLVDDNDDHNFLHEHVVRAAFPGAVVRSFERASCALDFLQQHDEGEIDLILVDVNMPIMNGFEFVRACVEHGLGATWDGVIVMMSTSDNPMDIARAKTLALVADYLCKPLDVDVLSSAIQR